MAVPDKEPAATLMRDDPLTGLATDIRLWAAELGFARLGISRVDLAPHDRYYQRWLAAGHHGEMEYMERHGARRWRPAELIPGTIRVISVTMDYRAGGADPLQVLEDPARAYVARYALGRDYHKLMRARLAELAKRIRARRPDAAQRVFVDSAPVLERAIAQQGGIGWIGKNTMLIDSRGGSWFFLGEIYTDIALAPDLPFSTMHCGSCTACLEVCPTQAFVGPFELDARRCISYLTIELHGSIPPEIRPLLVKRGFGCAYGQLDCPWHSFATPRCAAGFLPRHGLDDSALSELFGWSEQQFLERAAGSPLYRLGHARWLRNLAVALGNGPATAAARAALQARLEHPSTLVREHVAWALARLQTLMRKNVSR